MIGSDDEPHGMWNHQPDEADAPGDGDRCRSEHRGDDEQFDPEPVDVDAECAGGVVSGAHHVHGASSPEQPDHGDDDDDGRNAEVGPCGAGERSEQPEHDAAEFERVDVQLHEARACSRQVAHGHAGENEPRGSDPPATLGESEDEYERHEGRGEGGATDTEPASDSRCHEQHGAERCSGGYAEHVGICQAVAGEGLQARAGDAQTGTDDGSEEHSRGPELPHDLVVDRRRVSAAEPEVSTDHAPDLTERKVDGPDGNAEEHCRDEERREAEPERGDAPTSHKVRAPDARRTRLNQAS